ncbi:aromatic ring-hydroxylating oxygenase subunit alpha [Parafrankia discariae]|uniref:aromatic ring-hydroxylating oxygenase subunit alpha n=1 Tax=Parafrankia discariae TaxID=365528 RepID=UPI00037E2E91|nr:aromatic ring-hydroxylating dioxygenase subunit alpha [Parafrankia discariae]
MAVTDDRRADPSRDSAHSPARDVPFAIRDPLRIPRERYYDRNFFELENEYLWPRVWQMACRLEEIPRPGDFVEYEICDQSVLIVRQPDLSIRAFHNACRHRATQLCTGSGRLLGGQIVCPFHGWRWNLDGSNSFVYGADGFAPETLRPEDLRLRECRVDTWGACVWINMDEHARPLREALSPGAEILETVGVENLRVWWWKETILDANWKVAQEAFHEGYHVMATHPQLSFGMGEDYPVGTVDYTALANGHARFQGKFDPAAGGVSEGRGAEAFLARSRLLWEGQDAMTLERDLHVFEGLRKLVPPGEDFPTAAIKALFDYAAGAGIPLRPTPEGIRLWGGEVFLFPNFMVLPLYGNALSYRVRPYGNDPEKCRFEVWSLTMYPEGAEPGRATLKGRFAPDDTENWGLIPRQDFGNIGRQQRGLHSRGFREHRLAARWEPAIGNMHAELDRYLAG